MLSLIEAALSRLALPLAVLVASAGLAIPAHADDGEAPPITDSQVAPYLSAPKTCLVGGFWSLNWGDKNQPKSNATQMEIHQPVFLVPDLPYVRWWLPQFADGGGSAAKEYDEDTIWPNLDTQIAALSMKTRTVDTGVFGFENVPCGRYVVLYETWTSFPDTVYSDGIITRPTRVWNRDLIHAVYESQSFVLQPGALTVLDMASATSLFSETWRGPEGV